MRVRPVVATALGAHVHHLLDQPLDLGEPLAVEVKEGHRLVPGVGVPDRLLDERGVPVEAVEPVAQRGHEVRHAPRSQHREQALDRVEGEPGLVRTLLRRDLDPVVGGVARSGGIARVVPDVGVDAPAVLVLLALGERRQLAAHRCGGIRPAMRMFATAPGFPLAGFSIASRSTR